MFQTERAHPDGARTWFGHADVEFFGPGGEGPLVLKLAGEPPRGDSLHTLEVAGTRLPGFIWGDGLAWSPCGRYVVMDHASSLSGLDRSVVVLQLSPSRYYVLPNYFRSSRFVYPNVFSGEGVDEAPAYVFSGVEEWRDAV